MSAADVRPARAGLERRRRGRLRRGVHHDADFVDVRGVHHHGRAAIASGHQAIFDSIYRGSTVRYTVEGTRQLVPTCSLALVGAVLDVPDGPLAGRRRARLTAVVVEREGATAIAAFHNTLVEAALTARVRPSVWIACDRPGPRPGAPPCRAVRRARRSG